MFKEEPSWSSTRSLETWSTATLAHLLALHAEESGNERRGDARFRKSAEGVNYYSTEMLVEATEKSIPDSGVS